MAFSPRFQSMQVGRLRDAGVERFDIRDMAREYGIDPGLSSEVEKT